MPNNVLVTITVDQETNDRIIDIAATEGISKAELIRRAIDAFLSVEGK